MLWTLDLKDEIESDLSVLHRIDDPESLDASRYYRLVEMLPSYNGAVRRRFEVILREAERNGQNPQVAQRPAPVGAGVKALVAKADHGPRSNLPGIEYRGR